MSVASQPKLGVSSATCIGAAQAETLALPLQGTTHSCLPKQVWMFRPRERCRR